MDAAGWDARYSKRELVWGSQPNRFVAAELTGLGPGRALDVACGEGRNAIWLASRGWNATGSTSPPPASTARGSWQLMRAWASGSSSWSGTSSPVRSRRAGSTPSSSPTCSCLPQDERVLYTPDDVLADLAALPGLVVEKAERVRRPVSTPDGDREAVDALVRVRRAGAAARRR
jgi:Tellurite resistance protein TehB